MLRLIFMLLIFTGCSSTPIPEPPPSRQRPAVDEPGDDGVDNPAGRFSNDPWKDPDLADEPGGDDDTDPTDDGEEPGTDDPGTDETPGTDEPDVRSSGGSGGEAGLQELTFTDSEGLRSTYKINVPDDAVGDKVYGLHIHLHGDGGGGYRDFPNEKPAHDLIGVTVKAPNFTLQWGRFAGVPHARYVNELIQNVLIKKFDIDLDRIYFSGVSGGAYFLTGNLIPAYGHLYNSGAFVLCGGERPRVPITDDSVLTNFRIYWQVTARERGDIMRSIDDSRERYAALLSAHLSDQGITDFDTTTVQDAEVTGESGHCEFDDLPYTQGIQSIIDRKFDVVFKP